jgi:hypothetical protein
MSFLLPTFKYTIRQVIVFFFQFNNSNSETTLMPLFHNQYLYPWYFNWINPTRHKREKAFKHKILNFWMDQRVVLLAKHDHDLCQIRPCILQDWLPECAHSSLGVHTLCKHGVSPTALWHSNIYIAGRSLASHYRRLGHAQHYRVATYTNS